MLAELVARGGNKLNSPIGAISVGNPSRKTRWKDVAEQLKPVMGALRGLDFKLEQLADDCGDTPSPIRQGIEDLRAQLQLVAGGDDYDDAVVRHTKVGDPSARRPNNWTKSTDDEETDDE